ncbi:MAG: type II toxin-antitoxin system prevent-host-death family antitoxin [Umezawaea sp.]
MARITAQDLVDNTAEVLARVTAGETIEVTQDGVPVALLSPPDLEEAMINGLVKAGILSSDWRTEQAELKRWLTENPPLPPEPDKRPLSEVVIDMREEETR